jgi:response regulator RpfG family c-di-GMP phosphodiesterase
VTPRPRVLCVDDEPNILAGFQRNLRSRFDVTVATGGAQALEQMRKGPPFAAIVSDMRMPGMDGAQFLSAARTLSPDSVRILLTGHADFEAALSAVNDGQIFRFLTKPCPHDVVVSTLEEAARQFRLVNAERELLEQTLAGAIKTLSEVLALSNPAAFGRASRVHRTVAVLCERLKVLDRWALEVAARLSQIGCIQLPSPVAEKLYFGQPLTPAEQVQVKRVPALADQLLANIPRLEPVREILAAQERRYDGADDPTSAQKGEALPLGARLLKLAVDLDTLEASGASSAEALAVMQARLGAYDLRLLEVLEEEVASRTATVIQELSLSQIQPGMLLVEDVRNRAGVLLVARGHTVSAGLLMKLQNLGPALREPIKVAAPMGQAPAEVGRG